MTPTHGIRFPPSGRYIFLRVCTPEESAIHPELCADPDGTDRVATAMQPAATIDGFATGS